MDRVTQEKLALRHMFSDDGEIRTQLIMLFQIYIGAMAIVDISWSLYRKTDSEIPPDVIFRVTEKDKTHDVLAHRLLLAGSSPVFRKQFFGSMKEEQEVIEIQDTTLEAFTVMINFIYRAPTVSFTILQNCPQKLCEILNISERYQVSSLTGIVRERIQKFTITSRNMMFTAATAKNYAVFDDVSKILTGNCQKFLTEQLKTAEDVYAFMLETRNNYPDADPELLFEPLRANAKLPKKCMNCLRPKADCLDGQVLTGKESPAVVRKGLTVQVNIYLENSSKPIGLNSLTAGATYTVTGLYEGSGYSNVVLKEKSDKVGDNCLQKFIVLELINLPGVAGAVLQTLLVLFD